MNLDLNDLGRKATLANEEFEKWADNAPEWNNGRAHPRVVLALVERVRGLEAMAESLKQRALEAEQGDDL